jgi:hypothetical protein
MNVVNRIWEKTMQWRHEEEEKRWPNSIVLSPEDFNEFQLYLMELESNHSNPLTFLSGANVYVSKSTTEIKVGILL